MISHLELTKMGKTVPNVKVPKKTKKEMRRKKKRKWRRKTRTHTRGEDRLVLGSDKSSNLVKTLTEKAEQEEEKVEGLDDIEEPHDNDMVTGATGPPPQEELDRSRLQGKNLEQEQESQKGIPRRKNQIRGTGATRPPSQKEFQGLQLTAAERIKGET